jgi:hypothetical protein
MLLSVKQKEYIRIHGWKISLTTIATTIVSTILILIFNLLLKYAKPEAWADYINTKFITTTMNLVYLYGGLILLILVTGGYDALKSIFSCKTEEERKWTVILVSVLAICTAYLCGIGV